MGGKRQKALLPVLGTPIIRHITLATDTVKPKKTFAVVGFDSDSMVQYLSNNGTGNFEFAYQREQRGTGHALSSAMKKISARDGEVVVVNGDIPGVTGTLIKKLVANRKKKGAALSFVTAIADNPDGYGRVVRSKNGDPEKIVEHRDASVKEKRIDEINAGIYCFKISFLRRALALLNKKNAKGEYYITDLVEIALRTGERTGTVKTADFNEITGVNTPSELAAAQKYMRERTNARLMSAGVIIADPSTTYICPETKIRKGALIQPCCFINRSFIGTNCVIEPCSQITNSKLGADCRVEFSSILDSCDMRAGSAAGPFARIRPETVLMEGARAGSFVEIKKSLVGKNSKIPHLSYVGDSALGAHVNIGAGTITCNYDGNKKHRTIIGDEVFIGSDTILVAPVKVDKGASTAAGSVITKNVSPRSLAIGRSKQKEVRGWRKPGDKAAKN
ncbi:MAG: UDP-N-acetylglucosamine diphosphorylase/glucosamine-1-phosphate N-acetyltransferase [Candidatus Mycalebacterium zealandia]|nr:MAG: UDP-N-acetylglucosamine diphosphorylase/glucosamine-1-phosphate N-acetyltransferase [Candidatus Mycalebacterium zealandia]